jgi:hypothetical protein
VTATPRPYLDGRGWAPAGQAWLVVSVVLSVPPPVRLRLDLAASLTLRGPTGPVGVVPAGTVLVPTPDPAGGLDLVARWTGAVAVPAGLRSLTASFAVVGTFTRPGSTTRLGYVRHPVQSTVPLRLVARTS